MTKMYFLNNGDVVLATEAYVHTYEDASRAAEDYNLIKGGADTDLWDNNEIADVNLEELDSDTVGVYAWAGGEFDSEWANVKEFAAAL